MPRAQAQPFRVRQATADDRPAVDHLLKQVDLTHAQIAPDYFSAVPAGRGDAVVAESVGSSFASLWVAEAAHGDVVGLCHVQLFDTPRHAGMVRARRAHIESIVVEPRLRRSGCGRQLMKAAVKWARDRKAREMLLTVWSGNESAMAFYRTLGFREVNTVLGMRV